MSRGPAGKPLDQQGRGLIAGAFGLAATVRIALVLVFPTIHGGDAAARLSHADTLVLGYQLPLPQLIVMLGKTLSDDPVAARLAFGVLGAALAAGMTALLTIAPGSRAAVFGAFLFASDPLLVHYSIVPYQESMAYGLVAWAFFLSARGRCLPAVVAMGAACLGRYEAWLFLPVFIGIARERRLALLASLPVLGWILWWSGLAPPGLYVLDIDASASRLPRVGYLAGKFLEYESALPPALGGLGLVLAIRARDRRALLFAGTLALVVVVVIALGHEFPPGTGLMSERLIHVPVLLCLAFAALGLGSLTRRSGAALAAGLLLTLGFAARNISFEVRLLQAAARDPDLAIARETARAIESNRASNDCVSVSAPAVDSALLDAYVAKVGASFGDVASARARAAGLSGTSPDRDRIAAHLKAPAGTVRDTPGCPLLVIVDDAGPPPPAAVLLADVSAGRRRARLLRIPR